VNNKSSSFWIWVYIFAFNWRA